MKNSKKEKGLGQSSSTRKEMEHLRKASSISAKANRPAEGPVGKTKRKKVGSKAARRVIKAVYVKPTHARLLDWARLVSNPFVGTNTVRCPLNFNPAPSYLSFPVTLVDNQAAGLSVSAGFARQLFLWPGHAQLYGAPVVVGSTGSGNLGDMDEVAFHAPFKTIAGSLYSIGPLNSYDAGGAIRTASMRHLSPDALTALGGVVTSCANGSGGLWDNPLPLTADPRAAGHMRWKMISMGIKIINTTPAANRGGNVVSVQPATVVDMANFTSQSQFDSHPSFTVWGDASEEVTICWTPRPRDLAFWHSTPIAGSAGVGATDSTLIGPAIVVWFNAPSAFNQTYTLEIVTHFEIAGYAVQTFSSPAPSLSTPLGPVQAALTAHVNSSPTAEGFVHTVAAAVGATGAKLERVAGDVAAQGVHAAKKAVVSMLG
jgi:hypothetical protein